MGLLDKVRGLPSCPGVYLMKDSKGGVLYVGKSKNLRSRVNSYFLNSKNHSEKVKKLVKHLKDFDYIQTDTEFEAFMLECQLIKEIKPLYNRMMKSPESYAYIVVKTNKKLPTIEMSHSKNPKEGEHYFGPFSGKRRVEKAIEGLKEFYRLECGDPNRNSACLNYSLGTCMGICFDSEAIKQYKKILNKIIDLLRDHDTNIFIEMEQSMVEAAQNNLFEKAARIRDIMESVKALLKKEAVLEFVKDNKNIAVMEKLEEQKCKLFLIKRNHILHSEMFELHKDEQELKKNIHKIVLNVFPNYNSHSQKEISKAELDEIQIIYRYLESNNCEYVIIPDNWLTENHQEEAIFAIKDLITRILHRSTVRVE